MSIPLFVYSAAWGKAPSSAILNVMLMKEKKFLAYDQLKAVRRIIITHVALLAFFGGVALAFAQQDDLIPIIEPKPIDVPPPAEIPPEEKPTVAPTEPIPNATFEQNLLQRQAALQARSQERIINLTANVSNRIDAIIVRFLNISQRLESRIEKVNANGLNTSEATRHLAEAQAIITEISTTMQGIDTAVAQALSSADVRTNWQTVRATLTSAQNNIERANRTLTACITAIETATPATTPEMNLETTPTSSTAENL
jgi:hypothetical protein